LRDYEEDFRAKGAEVVAIGMGIPAMAADFKEKQDIPFRLLVDQEKRTYKALDLDRSVMAATGPQVWLKGARSILKGHGMAPAQQDWQQLGGALVVDRGGRVLLAHRAKDAADNAPVRRLLEALP
jgi:peroxiredoxin